MHSEHVLQRKWREWALQPPLRSVLWLESNGATFVHSLNSFPLQYWLTCICLSELMFTLWQQAIICPEKVYPTTPPFIFYCLHWQPSILHIYASSRSVSDWNRAPGLVATGFCMTPPHWLEQYKVHKTNPTISVCILSKAIQCKM